MKYDRYPITTCLSNKKNVGIIYVSLELQTFAIDDGLAMSSRNVFLSTDQRSQALIIHRALHEPTEQKMVKMLDQHGLVVEYAVIRDEATLLEPIKDKPKRSLIAAKIGNVRLIDNCSEESSR